MLHARLRAAAGRDRIPTDGLVAWYTMDNISGSTLVDEMGNYDGTITGATQTSGVIGQALNFDGNDYVASPSIAENATTTICFWANLNSFSTAVLLEKNQTDYWGIQAGNNFGNYLKISKLGAGDVLRTTVSLSTSVWHHFRFEITQNQMGRVFVDNVEDVGADGGNRPLTGSTANTLLGSRSGSAGTNGSIDDLFVYNRALSVEEGSVIYERGA